MQKFFCYPYSLITALLLVFQSLESPAANPLPAHRTQPAATKELNFQSALNTFRELSSKEKRNQIREIKTRLRIMKKENHRSVKDVPDDTVLLALLAVFLPPLAVYLKEEEINERFWISILLTLLFWVPGIVYALLVVFEVI